MAAYFHWRDKNYSLGCKSKFSHIKKFNIDQIYKKMRQHAYSIKWVHCLTVNLIKLINIVDVDGFAINMIKFRFTV